MVQLPIQSNAPPLQTLPLPLPGPAAKPAHPAGHTFTFTHCLVLSVYPSSFPFFYPFLLASSWTAGGALLNADQYCNADMRSSRRSTCQTASSWVFHSSKDSAADVSISQLGSLGGRAWIPFSSRSRFPFPPKQRTWRVIDQPPGRRKGNFAHGRCKNL